MLFSLKCAWSRLVHPCTNKPAIRHTRERYLLPKEWARVKALLDRKPPKVRVYFYVLILEGPRMSEARLMEWAHVDLQAGLWYKPITKTRKAQTLALSHQACYLLETLPRTSRYVFPGESEHVPWSPTAVLYHWYKIRAAAGCPDVQIRDLRRTCASWLAMQGESTLIIQNVLNHSSLAVTQVYARLDQRSVRQALDRHGARLMQS